MKGNYSLTCGYIGYKISSDMKYRGSFRSLPPKKNLSDNIRPKLETFLQTDNSTRL